MSQQRGLIQEQIIALGQNARQAASRLALLSTQAKNQALQKMAAALRSSVSPILEANRIDCQAAEGKGHSAAFLDRLSLSKERIEAMAAGLESIAAQPDPVGAVISKTKRPNGLEISQIRVPLGVIAVIYESRPNVTADAAGLCLKSGNAVILRGGSESYHSSKAILQALHQGLAETEIPLTAFQMVPTTNREAVDELVKLDQYIDVLIPRGGPELIKRLTEESRIPLFKHLAGICHTYIHGAADKEMAAKIVHNAKMRRTGICGATEVLLLDRSTLPSHWPLIKAALQQAGCEIRADEEMLRADPSLKLASKHDFDTEFLAPILAVKAVANVDEAIKHISSHGTQHTDAIITEDGAVADKFLKEVDSAIVMHNASTQFADGGEFGMGAEMGIATGKLHARGPVGAEQLTTFKYQVRGKGQLRS